MTDRTNGILVTLKNPTRVDSERLAQLINAIAFFEDVAKAEPVPPDDQPLATFTAVSQVRHKVAMEVLEMGTALLTGKADD